MIASKYKTKAVATKTGFECSVYASHVHNLQGGTSNVE